MDFEALKQVRDKLVTAVHDNISGGIEKATMVNVLYRMKDRMPDKKDRVSNEEKTSDKNDTVSKLRVLISALEYTTLTPKLVDVFSDILFNVWAESEGKGTATVQDIEDMLTKAGFKIGAELSEDNGQW